MTFDSRMKAAGRVLGGVLAGIVLVLFVALLIWPKFLAPWPFTIERLPDDLLRPAAFFGGLYVLVACVARAGRWIAVPAARAVPPPARDGAAHWPWPEPEAVKEMLPPRAVVIPSLHNHPHTDRDLAECPPPTTPPNPPQPPSPAA